MLTRRSANVGISLGHPSVNSSLSTKFSVAGKLVICAMMIRGRHRGMPYELDRAIMLPDEHLLQGQACGEAGDVKAADVTHAEQHV